MTSSISPTSAGARLRRTFHYPADDDENNSDPDALDEEEQSTLISTLAHTNLTTNQTYTHYLLVLPLLSSIPCLLALLRPLFTTSSTVAPLTTQSIFALTSLLTTSLQLRALPPERTGINPLDKFWFHYCHSTSSSSSPSTFRSDDLGFRSSRAQQPAPKLSSKPPTTVHFNPLAPPLSYVAPLNLALLATNTLYFLLLLLLLRASTTTPTDPLRTILHLLPPTVYLFVATAKLIMASVDPEAELEGLRYGYKGA